MRRVSRTVTLAGVVLVAVLAMQVAPALAAPTPTATFDPLTGPPVAGGTVTVSVTFTGSLSGDAEFHVYRGSSCPSDPSVLPKVHITANHAQIDVPLGSAGQYKVTVQVDPDIPESCSDGLAFDVGAKTPAIAVSGPKLQVTRPGTVRATATLSGLFEPPSKGVTFTVARAADCSSIVAGKSGVALSKGDGGTFTAAWDFDLPVGDYKLIARYEDGDASNRSVSSGCGADIVSVRDPAPAPPTSPVVMIPSLRLVSTKGKDLPALPREGKARLDVLASNSGPNPVDRTITVDLGGLKPAGRLVTGLLSGARGRTVVWNGSVPVGTTKLFSITVRTRPRASVTVSGDGVETKTVLLTQVGEVTLATASPDVPVAAKEGTVIPVTAHAFVRQCKGKFRVELRRSRSKGTSQWYLTPTVVKWKRAPDGACQFDWDLRFGKKFATTFLAGYRALQLRIVSGARYVPVSNVLTIKLAN